MSLDVQMARTAFSVREPCRIDMVFRSSQALVNGDTVEVQLPNSWTTVLAAGETRALQSESIGSAHFVGVDAAVPQAVFELRIRPRHLTHPAGKCHVGRHIVATLRGGSVPPKTPIRFVYANTFAPVIAEREEIWIRVKGESPAVPTELTVTAGPAVTVRLLAPSSARPGIPFDLAIVSLDRYENPAETVFENEMLTTVDGTVVARGLTFAGRTRVPVVLPREGVYRFLFRHTVSNAVRVSAGVAGPYWGDLHIHTKLSYDAIGNDPYVYARDVSGLDFAAVTDHWESLGEAGYRQILQWARDGAVPGRFVTILADERNPSEWGKGNHNIYFRSEESFSIHRVLKPGSLFVGAKDGDKRPVPGSAQVMLVPHHTGVAFGDWTGKDKGMAVQWELFDDQGLRPAVEIYSLHGQSEHYAPQHARSYEFNGLREADRFVNTSVPGPHYAQDWWMAGRRIGALASSDDHTGRGGQRDGGVAAVYADTLTREAVFDAIRARRCYGTTGERILLDFSVNGMPMGGVLKVPRGTPLTARVQVWGTTVLTRIEILRFRFLVDAGFLPVLSSGPRPEATDADITVSDVATGSLMYYVRVCQEPVDRPAMAWSSPIWVDVEEG
jgi:hypothetical protein